MLEFRVLGPLEVLGDGRPIRLPGSASRRALAALALRPREWVSVDQLIDDIWGERPPASARKALQMHVTRLRRAMSAPDDVQPNVLVSGQAGYRLDVASEQLDVCRF